ncbi:ethylene-responsive transcription factor 6-like [Aegilops tauschii subsp. strangulata]|uniref:ethylene-responsive transcription factor 6-like n=1 Tax=Aegilops tauschii subsp. strangulata TaxID=200361 RepID=UPI000989FDB4|nr:ethylene-responsive transcription factor 6-like [Aegilops tauschii subsp. strangulata]
MGVELGPEDVPPSASAQESQPVFLKTSIGQVDGLEDAADVPVNSFIDIEPKRPLSLPPPRPRSTCGFRCVHLRPYDVYYAEIRSGDTRLWLGTFETAHKAARAYDAAAWRLGSRR